MFELCRRLTKHYTIHVLAPHALGAAFEEELDGLRVMRFRYFFKKWQRLTYQGGILANLKQNPWRYGLVPFFLLTEFWALRNLLRRERFDLIHAHWLLPQGLVAAMACRFLKQPPPLLCTSHGGDLFALRGGLSNKVKRFVLSHCTALTVVSRSMRDKALTLSAAREKIHVIPMGVDLRDRFVPAATRTEDKSLLFVGRLVEKKGLRYLIDALPLIIEKHPNASLLIAGNGPEEDAGKEQVARLGLNDHVHFMGSITNNRLPAIYQSADVVIFPSVVADNGDQEGFGLVLVEALGCECATVVSDLPAMQDIVIDGTSALVVPQKNVRQLANKVTTLLDHPALRRSLGKEGRNYVLKHYDWSRITQQYEALIDSCITQARAESNKA